MYSCTIIGLTDCFPPHLNKWARKRIRRGTVFSGGRRHHLLVKHLLPDGARWIDIAPPLDSVFKKYAEEEHVVIFASGDPLFYGFASTVKVRCPECKVRVFPRFSSLQMLAHSLCMPYHDMRAVSLTGRDWCALDEALIRGERLIGILTDNTKTPHEIYKRMVDYGYTNYRLHVGECLGNATERVGEYAPEVTYATPNCVMAEMVQPRIRPFGVPDEEFAKLDGRSNMLTKMPVRLATLAALGLHGRHSLWDIGFCTGSVSIEVRLQFPHIEVTAFERRPECGELIDSNARRLGVPGIRTVMGDFMETDLGSIAQPDAVFIGGHGGRLGDMLRRIRPLLADGGCIVFNSVTSESQRQFRDEAESLGLRCVALHTITVDGHNPITILRAE